MNISEIKKKYSYLGLTNAELKTIVNNPDLSVKGIIKNHVSTSDKLLKLLNAYLTCEIEPVTTSAFSKLTKLVTFIKEMEIAFSINDCVKLYETNNFFRDLVNKTIKKIPNNDFVFGVIYNSYCLVNNIDFLDLTKENLDNLELASNSLKQYLQEVDNYPLLTWEEERLLGSKISKGDLNAKNTFIKHNLRLVLFIAKKYLNRGMDIMDLIQEGNIGLIMAVDKFDWSKGYKFSTFAIYWIRHTITRSIANKAREIRIPVYYHDNLQVYQNFLATFTQEKGRMPTEEEIIKGTKFTKKAIYALEQFNNGVISYNQCLSDESDEEMGSIIADKNDNFDSQIIAKDLHYQLLKFLKELNLSEKEYKIILLRYGLVDGEVWTLEQLSQLYGISRERIRQLEAKVLKKIRSHKLVNNLANFTDNESRSKQNILLFREGYAKNNWNGNKKKLDKTVSLQEFLQVDDQYLRMILGKLYPVELMLVMKRYGTNFDTLNETSWPEEDAKIFTNYLIPVLKKLRANPNLHRRRIPVWLEKRQVLDYSLASFLKVDEATLKAMLNKLYPEEMAVVVKKYGGDFHSLNQTNFSPTDEYLFFKYVVPVMHEILINPRKTREKPNWLADNSLIRQVIVYEASGLEPNAIARMVNTSLEEVTTILTNHYYQCLEFWQNYQNDELRKLSRK